MGPSRFCRSVPLFFLSLFLVLFCVTPRLSQPIMLSRSRSSFLPHLRRLFSFSFFFFLISFLFIFHFFPLLIRFSVCLSFLSFPSSSPCHAHPIPLQQTYQLHFFPNVSLYVRTRTMDLCGVHVNWARSSRASGRARPRCFIFFLFLSF